MSAKQLPPTAAAGDDPAAANAPSAPDTCWAEPERKTMSFMDVTACYVCHFGLYHTKDDAVSVDFDFPLDHDGEAVAPKWPLKYFGVLGKTVFTDRSESDPQTGRGRIMLHFYYAGLSITPSDSVLEAMKWDALHSRSESTYPLAPIKYLLARIMKATCKP